MPSQIGGKPVSPKPSEGEATELLNVSTGLTDRQQEVLAFIRELISTRGYGPTVREIGARFQIKSPNGVMCHLKALEKKGAIVRESHLSRAITLSESASPSLRPELPLIGELAVGEVFPRLEAERLDFSVLFASADNACVRLSGSQFAEDHLIDQDILILRKQSTFHDGELALIADNQAKTRLRRLYRETTGIRLESLNGTKAPQFLERVTVIGVIIALVRHC